jgi:hypothetical protein
MINLSIISVLLLFSMTGVFAQEEKCLMEPWYVIMKTPASGFNRIESFPESQGNSYIGTCDSIPSIGWKSLPCGDFDLMVHTDGPGGSMREWEIFVGIGPKNQDQPQRGYCLSTFTVGWRTLQTYPTLPLPWIEDRDHDGKAELIIWSSFPLHEEASMAEYGMIAWVYQVDKNGNFSIDLKSSRLLADEIANVYRKPLADPNSGYLQDERNKAACFLERFANGQCTLKMEKDSR